MKDQNQTHLNAFMTKYEEPKSNPFQMRFAKILKIKFKHVSMRFVDEKILKKKHLRNATNRIETMMLKDAVHTKTLHNNTAERRRK